MLVFLHYKILKATLPRAIKTFKTELTININAKAT